MDVEVREGLAFERDGALPFRAAVDLSPFADLAVAGPGERLVRPGLSARLDPLTAIADRLLSGGRPVRALLFDKRPDRNWALGWHQDRVVAVRARVETPGFGSWSVKAGQIHVAPPMALLERMVTLRLHLDLCGPDNAPLKVALGSHRLGAVASETAAQIAGRHRLLECLAEPGDVWAYATPILHASDRAARPTQRRVLQVDYAADTLPGGLQWLGVEP